MKKRILSVLLALAMLVSLIPLTAISSYAAEEKTSIQLLWEMLAEISGANQIDELLDYLADVPTYSTMTGERSYKTYLSLGDSTTFGFGLGTLASDQKDFDVTYGWGKADSASWSHKLAEKLGIDFKKNVATESNLSVTPWYLDVTEEGNHFASLAMGNVRVWDLLYFLGEDEAYDGFTEKYMLGLCQECCYVTDEQYIAVSANHADPQETIADIRKLLKKNIENADLISIGVGGNDYGTYLANKFLWESYEGKYWMNWDRLYDENPGLETVKESFEELFAEELASENEDASTKLLKKVAEVLTYALLGGVSQIDDIVEIIHEWNPDADIVLTGIFNPYDEVVIQDPTTGATLSLGKVINVVLGAVNRCYRLEAQKHPSYVAFVDVTDVEIIADVHEPAYNFNLIENTEIVDQLNEDHGAPSHQTAKGHSDIAEWVYDALGRPEKYTEETAASVVREPQSFTEHSEKVLLLMKEMNSNIEAIVGTEGKEALSAIQSSLGDKKDTTAGRLVQASAAAGAFCVGFQKALVKASTSEEDRELLSTFSSNAQSLVKETIETGKAAIQIATTAYAAYNDFAKKFPMVNMLLGK